MAYELFVLGLGLCTYLFKGVSNGMRKSGWLFSRSYVSRHFSPYPQTLENSYFFLQCFTPCASLDAPERPCMKRTRRVRAPILSDRGTTLRAWPRPFTTLSFLTSLIWEVGLFLPPVSALLLHSALKSQRAVRRTQLSLIVSTSMLLKLVVPMLECTSPLLALAWL